jgi:alginate O-acetyltransferase complex protein AlgI
MWFNGITFWLFFALALCLTSLLSHKLQNRFLLAASYFFYGYIDWRFISLILFCTALNFAAGWKIGHSDDQIVRKRWVAVAVTISLTVLGVFKYLGFFTREISQLLITVGWMESPWLIHVALPVGISFFTFHALSYTIDVYRKHTPVCHDFGDFALFISFFPQLIAGPINRSTQLLPQIASPRPRLDEERFRRGLYLVLTGLFMKVVLADNMAWLANYVFRPDATSLPAWDTLLGVYAFALQIYGDFAGYSAIACGTAVWLGFDLMDNFRRPYLAVNPRDFWARWHISLSTWLRDYLYIPLGGNRSGPTRTALNLFITMVLGGLWHGAAWTFVAWGAVHGLWLILDRALGSKLRPETAAWHKRTFQGLLTFHIVCLTWLLFRASDMNQVLTMLSSLCGDWQWTYFASTAATLIAWFGLPWLAFEYWLERKRDDWALLRVAWPWRVAVYGIMVLYLLFFPPPLPSEFIYFQF